MSEETERIRCSNCGKSVSTPVQKGTVIIAYIQCPECIELEEREEAEEQPTGINPVLASMTCRDCGTTENVDDTGLCAFCEEDEIIEEENDFDDFEEAEE